MTGEAKTAAILVVFALGALAPASLAQAAWNQPVGGASPINEADDRSAVDPSLAAIGGVPYVAWRETDGMNTEIRAARLNAAGTAWEQPVGGASPINEDEDQDAFRPSLAAIAGVPYVAWSERDDLYTEIRVARLNDTGTAWEQVAGGAGPSNEADNEDASSPSLAAIGGVPYVAWVEDDEIHVARLNAAGTAWEQPVGGASPINEDEGQDALVPSLAAIGGVPHVAWVENNEIRVARLNAAGTAWERPVGGPSPINHADDQIATQPSLAAIGGVPYVAWIEADGTNYEVRVARLNAAGTAWEQPVGGASPINEAGDQGAASPSLAEVGGVPYVAWSEHDGTNLEIRASRLEPEFLGAATASATETSAELSVAVRGFGLPYEVGFDYGPGLGSQTATTETSAETETVTQSVGGLSPSTAYDFRPFATAGVAAPRLLGAVGAFTTAATPPDTTPPDPPDTTPPDTTPPELKLAGKRRQRLGRFVALKASCPTEACALEAAGKLIVAAAKAKRGERRLRRFKLRRAKAQLRAGGRAKLKLRIPRKARKAAAKALKRGATVRAKIAVRATDAAGNRSRGRRTVRLVLPAKRSKNALGAMPRDE